jgi:hypothetical protein
MGGHDDTHRVDMAYKVTVIVKGLSLIFLSDLIAFLRVNITNPHEFSFWNIGKFFGMILAKVANPNHTAF